MLDYLGPAAETKRVSVGRIGLFGSGRVDRQRVSARLIGLYGSGHGDKEGLLGVLDYLGPAAETSFGVFDPMRLMRFDVGGRLGVVWTMEGYWILHWVMRVESVWT